MVSLTSLDDNTRRLFWRYPDDDEPAVRRRILDPEKGVYYYFRRIKTPIQARFTELMDPRDIPRVFLHGSPHLDNYVQTLTGAGIIDFDRAHIGPYAWDILCLLLSLSLRCKNPGNKSLSNEVSDAFLQAYLDGFRVPEMGYRLFTPLTKIKPKSWELSTKAYLIENRKWAKKLWSNPISASDPVATEVLLQYLASRNEINLLDRYKIDAIARNHGSFGRIRFLILLTPLHEQEDAILLDIKETKNYEIAAWPHTQWYKNVFDHQGKRMIAASKLYAPKCDFREGYASLNGVEYWGRQVPTFNIKPKKIINRVHQVDFAMAAGSQLGRGHRLSLDNTTPEDFLKFFTRHYEEIINVTCKIRSELIIAWKENITAFGGK